MIMVGGSGLYVDAVIKGLDDFPKVDPQIREGLKIKLNNEGIEALQEQLKELDLLSYERMDVFNKQRLIRALEICISQGKPYSHFLGLHAKKRSFDAIKIGLTADRQVIYDRINLRVDLMMEQGLLEEAQSLYAHKHLNALQTVGYRELFSYFDGILTLEEAVREIKKNTRRFAKRQGTWFRRDADIKWFDYKTNPSEIISYVESRLSV
jgi:tRNA dimethylallyltransferase